MVRDVTVCTPVATKKKSGLRFDWYCFLDIYLQLRAIKTLIGRKI